MIAATEPVLHDYGIHNENSDVRAHVSVVNRKIYVFRTCDGIAAVKRLNPPVKDAFQLGVNGKTATGWTVPWDAIEGIRRVRMEHWNNWKLFSRELTTDVKGRLAVECVVAAMNDGCFPFWVIAAESSDSRIQIKGTDIVVQHGCKIQVKCDYVAGEKPAGSGNLFLQKSERNPLGRH